MSIEPDDDVAGQCRQGHIPAGCKQALGLGRINTLAGRLTVFPRLHRFTCAVVGIAVHENEFSPFCGIVLPSEAFKAVGNHVRCRVGDNDDADHRKRGNRCRIVHAVAD